MVTTEIHCFECQECGHHWEGYASENDCPKCEMKAPVLFIWDCCCQKCDHEWQSHSTEDGKGAEDNICPECSCTNVEMLETSEPDRGQEI